MPAPVRAPPLGAVVKRSMKIGLQAWGSEGDIRPLAALAGGLARRGHDVELVYTDFEHRHYEALGRELGFRTRAVATPVVADPDEMTRIGLRLAATTNPLLQGKIITDRLFTPVSDLLYDAARDLCDRCDVVVGHFFVYQLQAAAELRGRPCVTVMFAHNLIPSRTMTPQGLPHLGTWGNAVGWRIARFALNRVMGPEVNRFRARAGVPPVGDVMTEAWMSRTLNLVGVSPALCHRPPDWPSQHAVCGFLTLPSNAQESVPDAVEAFLREGDAPFFMGFGSLMPRDEALLSQTLDVFEQAVARAGCRAIFQVPPGSNRVGRRGRHALVVERVSHAALFPHCAGVVHHGGAGTTHTVLRAGVPSIVVPHVADQFFWADELRRSGVATAPVSRRSLTATRLAARLRSVNENAPLRARAQALAATVGHEDGVGTAVGLIEQMHPR